MGNFEEYKNVWIFAEQRNGKLMNVSLELVGEGKRLSEEIGQGCKTCAVLIGSDVEYLSEELYEFGADKVYLFRPQAAYPLHHRRIRQGHDRSHRRIQATDSVIRRNPHRKRLGAEDSGPPQHGTYGRLHKA